MIVQALRHLRNIFMSMSLIFGSSYFFQRSYGDEIIGLFVIGMIGAIGFCMTVGLLWYLKRKESHGF